MELLCLAIQFLTGQPAIFVYYPRADRRVRTQEPLWAVVDRYPIRVELTVPIETDRPDADFGRVGERIIDGRTMVCDMSSGTPRPLDLMDRGPILVYHERHGLCLVRPALST
jgi:hypothetical protein